MRNSTASLSGLNLDDLMQTKTFTTKDTLKKWAKNTAGVVLTSVALMGGAQNMEFKFPTPQALLHVMETAPDNFPDGQYKVSYSNSDDIDINDLDYSKMAMVVSFEAQIANRNIKIGGFSPLIEKLADITYCCTINKTDPAYITASIWVVEPTIPSKLEELKEILQNYSVFYGFNDGSGLLTLNNGRKGNGASHILDI